IRVLIFGRYFPSVFRALIKKDKRKPYYLSSTCALAGENFAIVASDTRMSQMEINIITRDAEKVHVLNDSVILATSGFYGDVLQLKRVLQSRLHKYRFDYRTDMSCDLMAELLARNLYYRRFFPYYTGAILAGIDENGKGAVFSYDPIGCVERITYAATGAAEPMMIPFFDCQDAFRTAAEREISTGDKIHLVIAEAGKPIQQMHLPLRED
ncbi:peptidase, T1 family, partial [Ancylostoma caninum]